MSDGSSPERRKQLWIDEDASNGTRPDGRHAGSAATGLHACIAESLADRVLHCLRVRRVCVVRVRFVRFFDRYFFVLASLLLVSVTFSMWYDVDALSSCLLEVMYCVCASWACVWALARCPSVSV